MAKVTIGSISTGTLRTEDLLEEFAAELNTLDRESKPRRWSALIGEALDYIAMDDWTDDQMEQARYIQEELFDALNEYCPPFVYFGSHPGDGADYGFWPDVDALEEEMRYTGEDTADADTKYLPDSNVLVQVSDHGNILVMDMDRRELWSCV